MRTSGVDSLRVLQARAMAQSARDLRMRAGALPDGDEVRVRLEAWAEVLEESAVSWGGGRPPHLYLAS